MSDACHVRAVGGCAAPCWRAALAEVGLRGDRVTCADEGGEDDEGGPRCSISLSPHRPGEDPTSDPWEMAPKALSICTGYG